ncbi:protein CrcB [Thermovibrio guaymasensis]|uniref:Fluoride-specific ion channel FluC n=1 Tax=Thermovibrio guaymasensis TaxID=240167 RepID=A0A420W606_9BACT|nr:fluoride efflux transporter CrcB [Thermovibrio guaymasensis]RKQ60599.1 protein CrcB [Thermovibrio guaymasensis]
MNTLIWIGTGGFFGAIARFLISGLVQKHFQVPFPVGTLAVNVLGSFLIGFFVLLFEEIIAPQYKGMLITGFLGALTTFSTFSYETSILILEGAYLRALLNVLLNVFLCLTATFLGMWTFKTLFRGL